MPGRGRRALVTKKAGQVTWELLPEVEEGLTTLLDELGKPLGGHGKRVFQEDPQGITIFTVKTNRPGLPGELFVKIHRSRKAGRLIMPLFARTPASIEWRMAAEHARRGLPAPRYLAKGEKRRGLLLKEEYLIQESLTNYESFGEFFRSAFRPELPGVKPQDKRRVIRDLAGLIRRMHDRGVSRPNIEPHNIMAAPRSGGGVTFVFRDLEESVLRRSKKAFSAEERVLELARFHKSFSPLFSQGYRIRFYRDYFSPDRLPAAEFQELVKRIVDLSNVLARKEEPEIVKEVRERRPPFFWFNTKDARIYLRKPLYQNSLLEALDKIEGAEGNTRVRIKAVGGAPIRELMAIRCTPQNGLPHKASGPAGWAFMASAILDHHGVSHFRALAAMEPGGDRPGWFLAPVPGRGEYSLAEYLARRVADEFSGITWDRKFLIRVARFMLALHEAGWYFPRPSGDDLWVRYTDEGTHEIRVFNIPALRSLPADGGQTQVRNLFDLWSVLPISRTDGIMLAEEYLRFCRGLSAEKDMWIRHFMHWQSLATETGAEAAGRETASGV